MIKEGVNELERDARCPAVLEPETVCIPSDTNSHKAEDHKENNQGVQLHD
jgi:hypothetical protein